ncbi:helix-turn-helix transcriptional regulator [Streptomyces sp. NPDC048306]|uniref:helix-turn-helix domain-containing protein n=1 Tax=Streptomyces sp. NPDC048306 TaxID=3154502 RepID=UPI0033F81D47
MIILKHVREQLRNAIRSCFASLMTPDELRTVGELRCLAASGHARALREARHIGLRELARTIGTSPSTVSRWETGATQPRGALALKWAQVLGLEGTASEGDAA